MLLLPPPTCIARTIAIPVHVYCARYDAPPIPPWYAIHYTILVMAISCKGQLGEGGSAAKRSPASSGGQPVRLWLSVTVMMHRAAGCQGLTCAGPCGASSGGPRALRRVTEQGPMQHPRWLWASGPIAFQPSARVATLFGLGPVAHVTRLFEPFPVFLARCAPSVTVTVSDYTEYLEPTRRL